MTQNHQTEEKPEMRAFTVRISEELWEKATILGVKQRTSLSEVVTSALQKYVEDSKAA